MIGLNGPADMRLAPQFYAMLGARWIRVVLKPEYDLTPWITEAHRLGLKVLGVIARESLVNDSYNDTAAMYSARYGHMLSAVQAGNESDHSSESSWTMEPSDLNDLLAAVNLHWANTTIVGPGLVSGNPHYLDAVDLDLVDAIACHPYGRFPNTTEDWSETPGHFGTVAQLLDSYRYHGKRLWVTEWGVSTDQVSEEFQSRYVEAMMKSLKLRSDVEVQCYFCADDNMVPEFGLFDDQGNQKPAAAAFIRAANSIPKEESMAYTVGQGVLEQMKQHGDQPATDEIYHPIGAPQGKHQYSETFGKSGTRYVYVFDTNTTYRFSPTR